MNTKSKYVQIKKGLKRNYEVLVIDFGWCLYEDFKNGYDVEINVTGTYKNPKSIEIYLWFDRNYNVRLFKCKSYDEIDKKVGEIKILTEAWIKEGKNNRGDMMAIGEEIRNENMKRSSREVYIHNLITDARRKSLKEVSKLAREELNKMGINPDNYYKKNKIWHDINTNEPVLTF